MIIFHGDYKDLNCVNDELSALKLSALKDGIRPGDIETLIPLWDKFKSGKASLAQKRLTNNEICSMPKIIITNSVFEDTQYTTYDLVQGYNVRTALSHYKSFPNKFIDRENGFIVLEKDENRGYVPKSLEEVKEREIAFQRGILERIKKKEGVLSEKIIALQTKLCMEKIVRWEGKTETRWFHETELTKDVLPVELEPRIKDDYDER